VRLRWVLSLVLALCLSTPQILGGQETSPPSSYARRGIIIGGVSGGLLGGLSLGTLGNGLCESECDHAFREGFLIGFLAGGVLGGLTGMVIGAAVPRGTGGPQAVGSEGWALGLGLGPRRAGASTVEGTDLWVGVSALRPTTTRVRWGLELGYLGKGRETQTFSTGGRDGETTFFTNKWRRSIWNLSLVATRSFRRNTPTGGYLLATVGAYPLSESLHSIRTQTTPDPSIPGEVSERSLSVLPGGGIGGGGLWGVGDKVAMGLDSRLHLILGAGDESVLPVFSLGVTVRRMFFSSQGPRAVRRPAVQSTGG